MSRCNNQFKLHKIGTHKRKEVLQLLTQKLIKDLQHRRRKVDAVDIEHIQIFVYNLDKFIV
jgi:hypothetical protein